METLYRNPGMEQDSDQRTEQDTIPSFSPTELGATALESLAATVDSSSFAEAPEGLRATKCSASGSSPHQMVQDD